MITSRMMCAAALVICLAATGCSTLRDSQVKKLDPAALAANEGYVVGTVTTVNQHDDGQVVVKRDHPDIDYTIRVREEKVAESLVDAILPSNQNSRIFVRGQDGPALFALKLTGGKQRLSQISIQVGDGEWVAPIGWAFDVTPGAVTYIGDVWIHIDSEEGWFGSDVWTGLDSNVREARPLLDELMRKRFPAEHPDVRVSLASPVAAGR